MIPAYNGLRFNYGTNHLMPSGGMQDPYASPYAQNPYATQNPYGVAAQNPYGVVAQNPVYTGGNMYGLNSPYGLYGQNTSMMLAESPYARLTGQTTVLSPQAIPNLSSFQQSLFVDMNGFLGNTTGIPTYPSFIGATAMQQSQNPLFQTYQQYQQTQPQMVQQQQMIMPPVQQSTGLAQNQMAVVMKMMMLLIMGLMQNQKPEQKPLEDYQDGVDVNTGCWGDPHFSVGDKTTFDFQGKNDGQYQMLENQDITLNARFSDWGDQGARIIKDQNLKFKGTGVSIMSHADGKFEIMKDGKKIGDQETYNKDQTVIDLLKQNKIDIKLEDKKLTTSYNDRTLVQQLNGGYIDNAKSNLKKGDVGLLTQSIGADDKDNDGKANGLIDVNKDGKVDDNDVLNYDPSKQYMINGKGVAGEITPEIEAKIKADIQAGHKQGSIVKGFNPNNGYTAMQWNEYIGDKLYSTKDEAFSA